MNDKGLGEKSKFMAIFCIKSVSGEKNLNYPDYRLIIDRPKIDFEMTTFLHHAMEMNESTQANLSKVFRDCAELFRKYNNNLVHETNCCVIS